MVGGVAVNFYGYLRFTQNVDILLPKTNDNLQNISNVNIRMIEKDSFEKLYKTREIRKFGNIVIPIVSISELIKMKKTKKSIDLIDVTYLKRLQKIKNKPDIRPRWGINLELEQLRHWKYLPVDTIVNWLDDAYNFTTAIKS